MNARPSMQTRVRDFLAERRRLGFELTKEGLTLREFARYIDARGEHKPLTVEIMAEWARRDKHRSKVPITWARRLKTLRPFARYLQQFEPRTEVPDESIFGSVDQRLAPHIYSEAEIVDLLGAARRQQPDLRGAGYEALFGLLASTGLRVSEAVHLCDGDVDLRAGMLTVRRTKFAKSRQVPLHPSTIKALSCYRRLRNVYVEGDTDAPFFVGTRGKRLGQALGLHQINLVFATLRDQLGWVNRGAHHAPRVHDLRHTFVVRRVMLWHQQGINVDQAMLSLSTYVGQAMVTNTYWYLSAVPELIAVAANKFESYQQAAEVNHA
jgi:integrase